MMPNNTPINNKIIPKVITKQYFKDHVGRYPKDDDLTRCNCDKGGKIGHMYCGWCKECDLPIFICGHMNVPNNS